MMDKIKDNPSYSAIREQLKGANAKLYFYVYDQHLKENKSQRPEDGQT